MEEANKPKKSWYKKPWGMLILTILFIFFVLSSSFAFLVIDTIKNPQKQNFLKPEIDEQTLRRVVGENNFQLGGENPKVTIVEFADFACSACKNSAPTIRSLSYKYKNDIKIIFRDYPAIADYSIDLTKAAHCAGEQGLFWIMHDKLFENQGINEKDDIFKLAQEIGVDGNKFTTCFDEDKYLNKIYQSYSDGIASGVQGTPTFFVNGEIISGDIPLETWYQIIDHFLNN